MNKFFYYYNQACTGANMPTVFANDPYVTEIKELLLKELQQVVYYIIKLKSLNENMNIYTDKVIEFIYLIIINLDFKKENFYTIIEDLYNNKIMLKKQYISICEKNNTKAVLIKDAYGNLSSKDIILKAVNKTSERDTEYAFNSVPQNKKELYEIMINLVLNACSFLIELKKYGINPQSEKDEVLNLLNNTNFPDSKQEEIINYIQNFSKINYNIMKSLYKAIIDRYGNITKTEVPLKIKSGKGILVSGKSFLDLEKILEAVKDTDINVYTHNGMINAFCYEKFKQYKNLIGHYQYEKNNYAKDFANFSGPIFISDNLIPKIDIIRGQIFTAARYPAKGISKIENDDFTQIIEAAKNSKEITKNSEKSKIPVGYNKSDINQKIDTISEKIKNNEIERIIIINEANNFKELTREILLTDYIISFNGETHKENIWSINTSFNYGLLYEIIEGLNKNDKNINEKICIFITDCNTETVAHILNFKSFGIKNIFLGQCCPNSVSPVLLNGIYEMLNVKPITNPKNDLETM